MIQMEDTLSQVRREYDLLRIEFEQMLAANEQTGKLGLVNCCGVQRCLTELVIVGILIYLQLLILYIYR